MKRLFDVCVSLLLLLLLSIVICIVAILVRIKLGSPILFKQERPGINGIPFYLYKFRTMTNEINGDGYWLPDEVRLTAFGKKLRKYSIDELPQLINVIKGDLSLVGPRPLLMEYLPLYSSKQAKRHNVKPGITGWAQINGRNLITWEEKFELDVWYVENYSFLLDLKIIVLTIIKVFKTEGINHVGHVTMEHFTGGEIEIKGEGK
ncbi:MULTISPECIES: sugar transferase [Bacillus cereus group]|uniref:sugar transferase n=1 Tax=Bacillus cereus group TaxID=86661 RepID=UPI000BE496FE|nr:MULTISPECIES: sugar transferase [Bacillus cereus group]ATI53915.1 sugar transferase [Bacillus cereus]USK95397.1 sugar transferase [Bacillus tropicus]